MNEIIYTGEHTLPGLTGNFFVVLSFVAALFSTIAFYLSTKPTDDALRFKKLAQWGFRIHAISVITIIGSLIYILLNHLYEYKYAWDHVNNSMPLKYVFSCLWEGQEGSFLLWTVWHAVLGLLLIRWSGNWQPWVMTVVSLVQVFLASMLLGVYFGEFQLGSNPFLLMREHPANFGLPWTLNPDYLSAFPQFKDGKGLNPLLQNYWMTIHPPTLFLGFAATLIPFAYGIAGLWKRDLTGWIRPAIPWAFFGVMILGTGILMGGAWAYEALGFGGFWAWDPVENASLVPWLTLVASAHLMVINQRKQTALFSTFILTLSSFILVLYSTFLTRSGVLGDSSVHSFVDSGILPQLLVYLFFFVAISTVLLNSQRKMRYIYLGVCLILFTLAVINIVSFYSNTDAAAVVDSDELTGSGTWIPVLSAVFLLFSFIYIIFTYRKNFPKPEKEEALWSREFWLFIGALVLTISALHITIQTSVNVGNIFLAPFSDVFTSLFETTGWAWLNTLSEHNFAAPKESERFYVFHRIQVPLAFILFLLVSIGQWLHYKGTDMKLFFRKMRWSVAIALIVTLLLVWFTSFSEEQFPIIALVFATLFAIAANMDYALRIARGKLDHIGPSIAHIGFALLILGAVVATSRQEIISQNQRGDIRQVSEDFNNTEDLAMYEGDTLSMGDYFVVYKGKSKDEQRVFCTIDYLEKLPKNYTVGNRVNMRGNVLYCVKDHVASQNFLEDLDDSLWSQELQWEKYLKTSEPWIDGIPGNYLFTLKPSILTSMKGNSREPSIKHELGQDLYTYLKYADLEEKKSDEEGWTEPRIHTVKPGDKILVSNVLVILDSLTVVRENEREKFNLLPDDIAAKVSITVDKKGELRNAEPLFIVRDSLIIPDEVVVKDFGLKLMIRKINPTDGSVEMVIAEHKSVAKDFIVYQAIIFPQINILWLGCLVMVIGTTMAIRHRYKLSREKMAAKSN